jgi:hypothetical protein
MHLIPELRFETNSSERLWSMLSWLPVPPLWPVLAILGLVLPSMKDSPYIRYNAILSIATGLILIPVSIITFGMAAFIYLIFFYWAYQAIRGETVIVPWVEDLLRRRGWIP